MFYGFVVTETGNNLLANMMAGDRLTITRVVMEKGTAESVETARKMIAPIFPGPEATSTVPTVDGASVKMIVEYRSDMNGGLQEGFWIGGFAVYGKTGNVGETMIYYASLGEAKQYVSAYVEGTAPDVRRYPISITVTSGVKVDVSYPAEAWVTHEEMEEALQSKADLIDGKVPSDQLPQIGLDLETLTNAPEKSDLSEGDGLLLTDSTTGGALKRVLWSNVKKLINYIPLTQKGAPEGVASLDGAGKLPAAQLPALGYDTAGTAAALIGQHNAAPDAHGDIRGAISTSIQAHNAAPDAHGDIRQSIQAVQGSIGASIQGHNADGGAHGDIRQSIQAVQGGIGSSIQGHNADGGAHGDIRSLIQGLQGAMGAKGQMHLGSYVGTNVNQLVLTLPFPPKMLYIQNLTPDTDIYFGFIMPGCMMSVQAYLRKDGYLKTTSLDVQVSGNQISLTSNGTNYMNNYLNSGRLTYQYLAIG